MSTAIPAGAPDPVPSVGLSYIDVLFGLAAGRAFVSAFDGVGHIPAVAWSHFLVALAVITCSWIGYHLNRRRAGVAQASFDLSRAGTAALAQIGLDIWLLALYYRLAERIGHDQTLHTEIRLLVLIFGLYLVWDLVDPLVSGQLAGPLRRAGIDAAWLIIILVGAAAHPATPWSTRAVVTSDIVAIVLLLAYRYVGGAIASWGLP